MRNKLSFQSVLCPFTSCALVRMTSMLSSRMLKIGFQYDPVLSMTACVQPWYQGPQAQVLQFLVEGSKPSHLDARLCLRGSGHHAYDDESLADVDASTPLNHCLNHALPPCAKEKPMLHVVGCSTGSKAPIGGALASARSISLVGVHPPMPITIFSPWLLRPITICVRAPKRKQYPS